MGIEGLRRTRGVAAATVVALTLLSAFAARAQVSDQEIAELNARIAEHGLAWTAGRTSVGALPADERARLLGPPTAELDPSMLFGLDASTDFLPIEHPDSTPRPAPDDPVFTWQDVDGADWTSPVTNQGQCGSCAIFAAGSTLEGALNVAAGLPTLDYDLSEQNLLSCTPATCETGTHHSVLLNHTLNHGVPDEACHPYTAENGDCADACGDIDERRVRAAAWGWVAAYILDDPTDEEIKAALAYGPVTSSMDVYGDYFSYVDGIYEPTPGLPIVGGHAVAIIGWNDEHDSWYCKNSWGTGWGQAGYFEMRRHAAGIDGPFSTWVQMDASGIVGSFAVERTSIEVTFEEGDPPLRVVPNALEHTAGDAPVPFWVTKSYDAPWLAVAPLVGEVGPDGAVLHFGFDASAYPYDPPGAVSCRVWVIGGHGLAHLVETRIVLMGEVAAADESDGGPAPDASDAADGPDASAGDCGCRAAGGGAPPLGGALLELLRAVL